MGNAHDRAPPSTFLRRSSTANFLTLRPSRSTAERVSVTLAVTSVAARTTPGAPQILTFDQPRVVIGRGAHADVRLPSRAVSDNHAVIRIEAGEVSITDEGSTNGTTVNGQPLVRGRKKLLRGGDRIGVPGFEIVVSQSVAPSDPPERTAAVARKLLSDALAAVGGEAAPPEIQLLTGRRAGQKWRLLPPPSRMVLGRGEGCDVVLDDVDCSRQHAELVRDREGVVVLRDLGSKNGIFVSGRRLTERRLRDGDEFQLGRSVLRYSDPAESLLRALEGGADEPAPCQSRPESAALPDAPPSMETALPEEGNASTAEPVPAEPVPAEPAPTKAEPAPPASPEVTRPRAAAPRPARTADWIVIALALVILGISIAALYFVLRGGPGPR